MTSRACRLLAALVVPFALASCADDEASTAVSPPPSGGGATLTGAVVKGVTAHAIITITAADGTLLATDESNALGAYSVTLPEGYTGAVKIVATAKQNAASLPPEERTQMRCDAPSGCKDASDNVVAFGQWFEVPLDFELSAVMAVNGWGIHLANVTPLSTLAAQWAATFPQGLDAASADEANSTMAAMFGLALTDLESNTSDIADSIWLQMASPQQVQLALLYATFAEITATVPTGMTQQELVDWVAAYFAGQGGALMESSSGFVPTIDGLLTFALSILNSPTIAGVLDFPGSSYNEVQASMTTLAGSLNDGQLTAIQPVSFQYFVGKLGPMGAQVNELLTLAGMVDVGTGEINLQAFIDTQWPHFNWLADQNNLDLVPVAAEAAVAVALSSLWIDISTAGTTDVVMPGSIKDPADELGGTYLYKINLNIPSKTLTLQGVTRGQTVNLTVGITGVLDAMANGKRFVYSVAGTVTNATASGVIDADLEIDAKNIDFTSLLAVIDVLRNPDSTQLEKVLAMLDLPTIAASYAYTADAEVWAVGSASLIKNDDPTQALAGNIDMLAFVDLAATGAQKLLSVDVKSAELVLPAMPGQVNHFYPDGGKHVLMLDLTQDLTMTVDGAATLFGVPEAVLHATGEVTNARLLFDHVRDTLVSGYVDALQDNAVDLVTMVDTLLAFDFSQLSAAGDATLTIADLGHEYRANLADTLLTVYQPFSNDVAFTAELMMAQQKVHFLLGTDQEPWDLRVMTTPTPRLALIGPAGQYADMTQEDVYALLDSMQLRDLLDEFVTDLFTVP